MSESLENVHIQVSFCTARIIFRFNRLSSFFNLPVKHGSSLQVVPTARVAASLSVTGVTVQVTVGLSVP
jgi:hypothetical protein